MRPPQVPDGFVHHLTSTRHASGLSLRALGAQLGVSFSTLGRIERGEGQPDTHTLHCLWYWLYPEPAPPPCPCRKCRGPWRQTLGWECPRCHACYAPSVLMCTCSVASEAQP